MAIVRLFGASGSGVAVSSLQGGADESAATMGSEAGLIADHPWTPAAILTAWIIVLTGAVLRLLPYLANRSLWIDEASVALNILRRSYAGLIGPLDYEQRAPVGFLIIEKAATELIGKNEFALRLIPLLAGILSLILFIQVARRFLRPIAALTALGLFAFSTSLVYYASEVKPYSTDVAMALLIVLLTSVVVRRPDDLAPLAGLAGVGILGLLTSFPSVFVMAGCVLVLIPFAWRIGKHRTSMRLMILTGCWVLIFLVGFLFFTTHADRHLYDYWRTRSGFMPWPLLSKDTIRWLCHAPFRALDRKTLGLRSSWLATLLFCLGCISLWQAHKWELALLLAPVAMTIVAAILQQYPMTGRLILFQLPLYLIIIAEGLDVLWQSMGRLGGVVAVTLTLLLFLQPVRAAIASVRHPTEREELKPVLDFVLANGEKDDIVYVYCMAQPAFDFYNGYLSRYKLGEMLIVRGTARTLDSSQYEADLGKLRGHPRVWILMSHFRHIEGAYKIDDDRILRSILDRIGTRLSQIKVTGSAGYLYDLESQ
jgi:hypothetical protein